MRQARWRSGRTESRVSPAWTGSENRQEDAWLKLLGRGGGTRARMTNMLSKCTPGYYNNEGQGGGLLGQVMGHPRGPVAFFKYLKKWRNSGKFKGVEFR